MADALCRLDAAFGSVESYLDSIGIDVAARASIHASLTERSRSERARALEEFWGA